MAAEPPPEEDLSLIDQIDHPSERKRVLVIAIFLAVSLLITAAAVVLYAMPAAPE